jgi:hypothetical protein
MGCASKRLVGRWFWEISGGPFHDGNAELVTHKVQMLAPGGPERFRLFFLNSFATNTYALPYKWF